jgi:hypothetical protein
MHEGNSSLASAGTPDPPDDVEQAGPMEARRREAEATASRDRTPGT